MASPRVRRLRRATQIAKAKGNALASTSEKKEAPAVSKKKATVKTSANSKKSSAKKDN